MKRIFILCFTFFIILKSYSQHERPYDTQALEEDTTERGSRAMKSPFEGTPFPMSDWCGDPVIGQHLGDAPDALKKLLEKASKKTWTKWNKTGIKIYGWLDGSMNVSSSKYTNSPMSYIIVPNRPVLDQFILRVERQPNTEQTKHIDWGFLVDNIYGIDYRYTISKGYVSDQLLKRNNLYGYDPTQVYALLYVPQVAQGMLIKVGRFMSPADIEAQWAPDNYLFSHSIMFTVDPYTFTGINSAIRLSKQVQIEFGLHAGNDMSPFCNSAQLNGLGMIRWVSKNNKDAIYGGLNSIGKGQYKNGHDDLQVLVWVWGHKFNKRLHMMTESYYMWEYNAALGGTAIYGPLRYGQGGGQGPIIPGISQTFAALNYFQILCSPKDYISIRNEGINDATGSRTGYATWYTTHTIGWSHHFSDLIMIRPEVRYEHAWNKDNVTPYDNGTKTYQLTAAIDLVVRF
jgi:putative OmpL-like beta-barrel porin-2